MTDDILRPLSLQEVNQILELCSKDIPTCIKAHNYLSMYFHLHTSGFEPKSGNFKIRLYTHIKGNLEHCTYVAITDESDHAINTFSKCSKELVDCLIYTKRIKWNLNPYLVAFQEEHLPELRARNLLKPMFEVFPETPDHYYYLPKNIPKSYEVIVPENVVLKPIEFKDVKLINDTWPHKYSGSTELVEDLLKFSIHFGIYSKECKGKLLSWGLVNEMFGLGMIQTLDNERRKGYAKLIVKALAKQLVDDYDLNPTAHILMENKTSVLMLKQLGFVDIGFANWLKLKFIGSS